MINHIISDCSKLAQREYKMKHDWVGKVIHWELCKKFKFDHTEQCHKYYVKARIDKTQQNSRCRLCGDRDNTINHISEISWLAQNEYKIRQD